MSANQELFELKFYEWEEKFKDKPYLRQPIGEKWEEYTWGQVGDMARRLASGLKSLNLREGAHIGIYSKNCREWIISDLAIVMAGYVSVPFFPSLNGKELSYIMDYGDVDALFIGKIETWDEIKNDLPAEMPIIRFPKYDGCSNVTIGHEWHEFINSHNPIQNPNTPKLSDLWTIIFTSGTTGNPKGVVLTHLNLLSDAMSISTWFKFNNETRCLCILPLFHNNGQITTLLAPLYAGGSTVIVKGKISLYAFWDLVNEFDATWTSVMASILSILLSLPNERKENSLSAILCGGQILTRSVQEQFESRFNVPIFEGYGLTETTSFSCINNFPAEKRITGSIGKSLSTNEIAILDEKNEAVGENIEGEICIRGYNVANGHLGDSKMNQAFRNGWFHSGDYGKKDQEGNFYFHGRQDSLIILSLIHI